MRHNIETFYLACIALLLLTWLIHAREMRRQYVAELARALESYIKSLAGTRFEMHRLRAWLHYFKAKAQPGSLLAQLGDRAVEGKEDPPDLETKAQFLKDGKVIAELKPIGVPRVKEHGPEASDR
jgi:hypothetical protein